MSFMPYVWIGILVCCLIGEALTTGFVAIWFFPAAIVSMILAFLKVPIVFQILAFLVVGLVLLIAFRPLLRRFRLNRQGKTNVDSLVGESCLVTETVDNLKELGEVKTGGLRWSARSLDDTVIPAGTKVTVVDVKGVKLIVKKS